MPQQQVYNLYQTIKPILDKHYHLLMLFTKPEVYPNAEELKGMQELRSDTEQLRKDFRAFGKLYLAHIEDASSEMEEFDEDFQRLFLNHKKIAEYDRDGDPAALKYFSKFEGLFRGVYENLLRQTGYSSKVKNPHKAAVKRARTFYDVSTKVRVNMNGQPAMSAPPLVSVAPQVYSGRPQQVPAGRPLETAAEHLPEEMGSGDRREEEIQLLPHLEKLELSQGEKLFIRKLYRFINTHPCRELESYKGKAYVYLRANQDRELLREIGNKEEVYMILAELCNCNWRDFAGVCRRYRNPGSKESEIYDTIGQFPELDALLTPEFFEGMRREVGEKYCG